MEKDILTDILGYIDFLRDTGYQVVLSCFHERLKPYLPTLLSYEPHMMLICSYLKSKTRTRQRCMANKARLIARPPETFCYASCWAGVEEYILPILHDDELICCVHITGYRGQTKRADQTYQKRQSQLQKEYAIFYQELSQSPPSEQRALQMIRPLGYMLKQLYLSCPVLKPVHDHAWELYLQMLSYIHQHHAQMQKEEEIAKELNYSLGYLRSVFQKQCGVSISRYLKQVRLKQAANLLLTTNRSITEIALVCGFSDSNYFSTAFKHAYGVSPRQYRNHP